MTTQRHHLVPAGLVLAALVSAACTSTAGISADGASASSSTTASSSTVPSSTTSSTSSTSTTSGRTGATGATSTTTKSTTTTAAGNAAGTATTAGLQQATWGTNVAITYQGGSLVFESDGLPNHARAAQYAVPGGAGGPGMAIPNASTARAMADPTRAQNYRFTIPTTPTRAASPTPTSGGTIGVMISGAALFNPYEADGRTAALQANFTVQDASGNDVGFLDACNGHPSPMAAYHYHGLPSCVTAAVDTPGGPSHLIGVAFDGYPIYGDRDINGQQITASQLDACNGITSPTPEFPDGIYHYVLLATPDASSSIRCFTGTVDPSLTRPMGGRH